jgi:hypothetical protein
MQISLSEVAELFSDFALLRATSLAMLHMLRESDWAWQGQQPEYGVFTAEEWLGHWVEHDIIHIKQINRTVEVYSTR